MYDIQKEFTSFYMKHNTSFIEQLKQEQFDVAVTTIQNFETYLAVAAGIPVIREAMFLQNTINQLFTGVPGQNHHEFPLIMWNMESHD
jgi:hypothetical protein